LITHRQTDTSTQYNQLAPDCW